MTQTYRSWGYIPQTRQRAVVPCWRDQASAAVIDNAPCLPFGNGRSYGDSCLNSDGVLLDMRQLNRFVGFDREQGLLCAEPGVTLSQILQLIVPAGWFLPVSPGTSFVTLGGAIANDVHGKNHHRDGCFGRFVESFHLHRSNGEHLCCTPDQHVELFNATIGGLGLTGLITQATIRLIPIESAMLDVSVTNFRGLDAFMELSQRYKADHRYTVAWLDCAAGGRNFARGVFLAANHASASAHGLDSPINRSRLSVPFSLPSWSLNRFSVSAFNTAYFHRHRWLNGKTLHQHYTPFFYPLDAIRHWNRIYGAQGFHQYQFVVPLEARPALEKVLRRIVDSGMGSFLAVLKQFGDVSSPGMLSFPRPGLCLALDFANRGARTEHLLGELDALVMDAGGAAYPAKDRLMSRAAFEQYFPRHAEFSRLVDPAFSSDFWKRVHG